MSEQTAEAPVTTGGVRNIQAPDGSNFDIMAGAPKEAAIIKRQGRFQGFHWRQILH